MKHFICGTILFFLMVGLVSCVASQPVSSEAPSVSGTSAPESKWVSSIHSGQTSSDIASDSNTLETKALPFYVGMFEYIVAEMYDSTTTENMNPTWWPAVHILKFWEDGSASYVYHYAHSEPNAIYEGSYTVVESLGSGLYALQLDLVCTFRLALGYDKVPDEDAIQLELTMQLDGPPDDRIRVTLNSGSPLFEAQQENIPNWFVKIGLGEHGSEDTNTIG